ncbi:MAG TPA: hypothetical protein VLL48_03705 [Longimicrobiales bacterium]|nr:hypothetical protein [Longimicrobiales bacterium]
MTPRAARLGWWSSLVVGAAAECVAEDGGPGPAIVERVENGVTIVAHSGLDLADTLSWSIDTTDVVRIGVMEGPEEEMIGRLAGYLLRPDGRILFGDGVAHELRLFDDDGSFVGSVGRAGEGPGEYGWLYGLQPYPGDSVAVLDNEGGRVTILDPDLEYVRRYRPRLRETRATPPMTSHRLIGFFDDGQALMSDFLNVCGMQRMEGYCQDSVAFFRTDTAGASTARFGRFVYGRSASTRASGVGIRTREPHPQAMWAVHGQRFYYADARRWEILVHRSDGTLERIIRVREEIPRYTRGEALPVPDPPAGREDDPELRATMDAVARFYGEVALPDSFPAFSDMLVDTEGNLWVREYRPLSRWEADGRPRWFVFDPRGHLTHAVRTVPAMTRDFFPTTQGIPRIGADRILGSVRDELGVERLVLHRLRKSGS